MGLGRASNQVQSNYNLRSMSQRNERTTNDSQNQQQQNVNLQQQSSTPLPPQPAAIVSTPGTTVTLNVEELSLTISRLIQEQLNQRTDRGVVNLNERLRRASHENEQDDEELSESRTETLRLLRETIPTYSGKGSASTISSFFQKLDSYFNAFKKITEAQKVTIASSKLTNAADIWWKENMKKTPWLSTHYEEFKKELRNRFILPQNERRVFNQLINLKQGSRTVLEFSMMYESLCDQLEDLTEREVITYYLRGLNPDIAQFVRASESNLINLKTLMSAALSQEENVLNSRIVKPTRNADAAVAKIRKTKQKVDWKSYKCKMCSESGHSERYCRKTTEYIESFKQTAKKAVTSKAQNDYTFTVDSGCSMNMVPSTFEINNCEPCSVEIALADNTTIVARETGNITMMTNLGYKLKMRVLKVSELHSPLFSVSAAANEGITTSFDEHGTGILSKDGTCIANFELVGRTYAIKLRSIENAKLSTHDEYRLWHNRMGHPGLAKISALRGKVTGFNTTIVAPENFICHGCISGKLGRSTFKNSASRAKTVLELIHMDIIGPVSTSNPDNWKYILTISDDFSGYVKISLLRDKQAQSLLQEFRIFEQWASTKTNKSIKKIRTDNGTEFNKIHKYAHEKGITVQTTVAYNPEQNGRAERLNRSIFERVRSVSHGARIPTELWPHVVNAVVYLINRTPSAVRNNGIPLSLFESSDEPLDLGHLRALGCRAYAHIPGQLRNKLDSKVRSGYHLGYCENSKGYKIYIPESGGIMEARDVRFNETEFFPETSGDLDIAISTHFEDISSNMNAQSTYAFEEDTDLMTVENRDNTTDDSDMQMPSVKKGKTRGRKKGEFTVESISQEERRGNELFYLVHWKNKNIEDSWEPYSVVQNCRALDIFLNTQGNALLAEVDLNEVPKTAEQALSSSQGLEWRRAMESELSSLRENDTWVVVKREPHMRVLGAKWIFRLKFDSNNNISRHKARYVVQGFSQLPHIDYGETFSPTICRISLRILLCLAMHYDMCAEQLDVTTAFLYGHVDREIFVMQPPQFEEANTTRQSHVCKLKRSLYGLRQSPMLWNERFSSFIISIGFSPLKHDKCVFVKTTTTSRLPVILGIYVDDVLILAEHQDDIENVKAQMKEEFKISELGKVSTILGLQVLRSPDKLIIHQTSFIKNALERFGLENAKPSLVPGEHTQVITPSSESEIVVDSHLYRSIIGTLLYVAINSRPDICFVVGALARHTERPCERHLKCAHQVLKYLSGTIGYGLIYQKGKTIMLRGVSDADWAGDPISRKSTTALSVFMGNSLVCWRSGKQSTVSLSSVESELTAAVELSQEMIYCRDFLKELLENSESKFDQSTMILQMDNLGSIQLAKSGVPSRKTRHVELKCYYLHDLVKSNTIELQHIGTEENSADLMTKALPRTSFEKHRKSNNVQVFRGSVLGYKGDHSVP